MTSTPEPRPGADDVRARAARALTGDAATGLVLVGNVEVEDRWAEGEVGLPRLGATTAARAVVARMDELVLALAREGDHAVLAGPPDPGFLEHLRALGGAVPTMSSPGGRDPRRTVTEHALDDPALLAGLRRLGGTHALLPHGVSAAEESLVERAGLRRALPPTAVVKAVNSKIYSRRLADELGLRQAPGRACDDLAQLAEAESWARDTLAAGRRVVVKDAFGVSGKGVVVVEDPERLRSLLRMVRAGARRQGSDRVAVLIEEWVAKRADLNYQFTVERDGGVVPGPVFEAVTEHGVHRGHLLPARLGADGVAELAGAARALGARLARDGYAGLVGVDAMIDPDGGLYPVVEINARTNMSTYQAACAERLLADGQVAMARHYDLAPPASMPFDRLADALGPLLRAAAGGSGVAVNAFATLAAAGDAAPGATAPGRLYTLLVADDPARLDALDEAVGAALARIPERSAAA